MCLAQAWNTGFFAIAMQLWLSHSNCIGLLYTTPMSPKILLNQIASQEAKQAYLYSTLVEERAIVAYFLLTHETTLDPNEK